MISCRQEKKFVDLCISGPFVGILRLFAGTMNPSQLQVRLGVRTSEVHKAAHLYNEFQFRRRHALFTTLASSIPLNYYSKRSSNRFFVVIIHC